MNFDFLSGRKTYVIAAGIILAAVGAFMAGEYTLQETVNRVLEGLGLAALRLGVSKSGGAT